MLRKTTAMMAMTRANMLPTIPASSSWVSKLLAKSAKIICLTPEAIDMAAQGFELGRNIFSAEVPTEVFLHPENYGNSHLNITKEHYRSDSFSL